MTERFSNFAQSTLATNITAAQTTISVASAASFPLLGNFRITVQQFDASGLVPISNPEIMIVTAVAGNQFTVSRGQESTTALAFPSGTQVAHFVTAGVMTALASGGGGVTSLNGETGAVVLVAGSNITLTPAGQNITIAASGGGSISQGSFNIIG